MKNEKLIKVERVRTNNKRENENQPLPPWGGYYEITEMNTFPLEEKGIEFIDNEMYIPIY